MNNVLGRPIGKIITSLHVLIVPLPCIVGPWSDWVGPDATGTVYRYRYMTRPNLNGGSECPDLMQLKKGTIFV